MRIYGIINYCMSTQQQGSPNFKNSLLPALPHPIHLIMRPNNVRLVDDSVLYSGIKTGLQPIRQISETALPVPAFQLYHADHHAKLRSAFQRHMVKAPSVFP